MFRVGFFVRNATIVCGVLLLALIVTPVFAAQSGLFIIPTAETVGADQYSLEYQYDGVIQGEEEDVNLFNTQIGIGDRFEAGIDFDLSKDADPVMLGNAKYLLYEKPDAAIGAGVLNIGKNIKSSPYIVGTKDLGVFRLHLGGMRIEGENEWFVGADRTFGKLTLMADYTSGEGNFSSAGISYQANDRFAVMAGGVFTNESNNNCFTLHLVYGASYRCSHRR